MRSTLCVYLLLSCVSRGAISGLVGHARPFAGSESVWLRRAGRPGRWHLRHSLDHLSDLLLTDCAQLLYQSISPQQALVSSLESLLVSRVQRLRTVQGQMRRSGYSTSGRQELCIEEAGCKMAWCSCSSSSGTRSRASLYREIQVK
jgi:hypothetical protein